MHRSVGLYSRIVHPKTGKTRYASVLHQNGRPMTEGFARFGASRIRHNGSYYLRVGDSMRAVGSSLRAALDARRDEEHRLAHLSRDGRELPTDDLRGSIQRWARPRGLERAWVRQSKAMLEDFASYAAGRNVNKVSEVRRDVILSYVDSRRAEGDKPATSNLRMRRIVSLLRDSGVASPLKSGRRGDWPRIPRKKVQPPSDEAMLAILANAASDDDRLLFAAYMQTGLRAAELLHTTYADLDAKRKTLAVTEKSGDDPTGAWQGKTENAVRTVPIPYLADKLLARQVLRRALTTDLIFPSPRNGGRTKPYTHAGLECKLDAAVASAKVGAVNVKDFRDGFSTRMWIDGGLDIAKVSALDGHAPRSVTERHYLPRSIGHTDECQAAAIKAFAFMQGHF
ncbi:MAG: tyrosine-type recombinase/integrase [Terriglobales bacterium]